MNHPVGARGYSIDLRQRVVNAVKQGESRDEVARRFSVHRQTVDIYLIKDELGTLAQTRKTTGRPRVIQECHEVQLMKQVEAFPDATLHEHARMLEEATGFSTSIWTINRVFDRHDLTLKKKTVLPSEQNEEERIAYLNTIQPLLNVVDRMVWIDESSFHLAMARRYARAHRSKRAIDRLPTNWGKNQTLICALQSSGPFAPFIFEGAVNGDAFVC